MTDEGNSGAENVPPPTELADVDNRVLLEHLDHTLLELERRLLRYARVGGDILGMADEGLVLAVRSGARLRQALSAAQHAAGHLQVLGVGEWSPTQTNPGWNADPRVVGEAPPADGDD
jgi:hypothetical protein